MLSCKKYLIIAAVPIRLVKKVEILFDISNIDIIRALLLVNSMAATHLCSKASARSRYHQSSNSNKPEIARRLP